MGLVWEQALFEVGNQSPLHCYSDQYSLNRSVERDNIPSTPALGILLRMSLNRFETVGGIDLCGDLVD